MQIIPLVNLAKDVIELVLFVGPMIGIAYYKMKANLATLKASYEANHAVTVGAVTQMTSRLEAQSKRSVATENKIFDLALKYVPQSEQNNIREVMNVAPGVGNLAPLITNVLQDVKASPAVTQEVNKVAKAATDILQFAGPDSIDTAEPVPEPPAPEEEDDLSTPSDSLGGFPQVSSAITDPNSVIATQPAASN